MNFQDVSWWSWALQLVAVSTSFVGAMLNARQDVRGFHIWIFSNAVLLAIHVETRLWILCLSDIVYTAICIVGIRAWKVKAVAPAIDAR